jgi:hypothetical protein
METSIKTWFLLLPDETVANRIKEFREKNPEWKILPEIIEVAPDWIVIKAISSTEKYEIQRTGHSPS